MKRGADGHDRQGNRVSLAVFREAAREPPGQRSPLPARAVADGAAALLIAGLGAAPAPVQSQTANVGADLSPGVSWEPYGPNTRAVGMPIPHAEMLIILQ